MSQRRQDLIEEYEAATRQLGRTIDEVERTRISRQLEDLERQIAELEPAPRRRRRTTRTDDDMETAVLTRMSSQLDKLDGDMQNVRDRLTRLESQMGYVVDNVNRLEVQVSHGAPVPRAVIVAGAMGIIAALSMLMFVVWRLL